MDYRSNIMYSNVAMRTIVSIVIDCFYFSPKGGRAINSRQEKSPMLATLSFLDTLTRPEIKGNVYGL